jgi:hypothetical protein
LVAGMVGATVNVTITESAGGIVATSDGTINSGVCTSVSGSFFFQNPSLQPNAGAVYFGDTNGSLTRCNTAVTPANIVGPANQTIHYRSMAWEYNVGWRS